MQGETSKLFKVAIAGDGLTGKTCLLNRYAKNQYSDNYKPTIGADFVYKEIMFEGKLVKLQFWDLSGQYVGSKEVTSNFFRGSSGVMICFSLIDNKSLTHVTDWRRKSLDLLDEGTPCVLIGTKCDLGSMPEENWRFLCGSENFETWFQTSAKNDVGVKEAFEGLVRLMLERDEQQRLNGAPQSDGTKGDLLHGLKGSSNEFGVRNCSC